MSRLLEAGAGQLMRLSGGRRCQRKDVAPQSSAISDLSGRSESSISRELVSERFAKAAFELKVVVGARFEGRSRTRCVGSLPLSS
jgi:hypothetical protein